MSQALSSPTCCSDPCESPLVENVPGPQGDPGAPGTDGTNGENAYTALTSGFIQPAVDATVNVEVLSSDLFAIGVDAFVETGGQYLVVAKPDATHVTLQNYGYDANIPPAGVIPTAARVLPCGPRGATGEVDANGALLAANNLNDVIDVSDARDNLGLGTLAVANSVNNANWSGTDLALVNGGTGASDASGARTNLGLGDLAVEDTVSNDDWLGTDLAVTNGGTGASTELAARSNLGKLLPRYGVLAASAAVNLNSVGADTAMTVEASRYIVDKVVVENASVSLTTAQAGVYTAAAAAGVVVAANQALSALTAASKWVALTLDAGVGTDVLTAGTLFINNGTAQSTAATANFWVLGWRLD